jgi:hypothetical protein
MSWYSSATSFHLRRSLVQDCKYFFLFSFFVLKSIVSCQCSVCRQLYAFLWQEVVIAGQHLTKKSANFLGAIGIPVLNKLCNKLTGFDHRNDRDFQKSRHVYPGDWHCNIQQAHSKWHEVTATGLADVAFMADALAKVIAGEQLPLLFKHDLFQCYHSKDSFSAFDWPTIAPEVSDVFESCFSSLVGGWPQPDVGGFIGCMISSTMRVGNTEALDDNAPQTLDSCLVEHACIAFDGLQLDVPRLKKCIGLSSIVSGTC